MSLQDTHNTEVATDATPAPVKDDITPSTETIATETPAPEQAVTQTPAKPPRLRSLDAFRGLTIVLMLLVNNIALDTATPKQLKHAAWNTGVHLADFVFPWFLFCVGVAIPFAAASFRRKGLPAWRYDLKVIGRAAALVLLGCLIDSSIQKRPLFTLGVLQNIGLAYMVAALLYDLPLVRRMLIAGGFLVAYWAAIMFLPIPGVGVGIIEENQNLIMHLNQTYLNGVQLWGLPSIIPTAALVMIASAIGDLLRNKKLKDMYRLGGLTIIGLVLVAIAFLWNSSLPFNKPLWTPSYILLTTGAATLTLGLFYLILDARGWWHWTYPLIVFGSNAIVAYVVPILTKLWVLQEWKIGKPGDILPIDQWLLHQAKIHVGPVNGGWLYTVGYILAWWVVLWILYRRNIFLRV